MRCSTPIPDEGSLRGYAQPMAGAGDSQDTCIPRGGGGHLLPMAVDATGAQPSRPPMAGGSASAQPAPPPMA
eukprot:14436103-Alexandrium_andersonii.AAC.1